MLGVVFGVVGHVFLVDVEEVHLVLVELAFEFVVVQLLHHFELFRLVVRGIVLLFPRFV